MIKNYKTYKAVKAVYVQKERREVDIIYPKHIELTGTPERLLCYNIGINNTNPSVIERKQKEVSNSAQG